jgi:hypothetical protein
MQCESTRTTLCPEGWRLGAGGRGTVLVRADVDVLLPAVGLSNNKMGRMGVRAAEEELDRSKNQSNGFWAGRGVDKRPSAPWAGGAKLHSAASLSAPRRLHQLSASTVGEGVLARTKKTASSPGATAKETPYSGWELCRSQRARIWWHYPLR